MKLIYLFKRIINKLAFGATSKGGRNFLGRVCVNARGRGNKKICHQIDFLRRVNCFGKVLKICAERGRTGFLGIILYDNGLSSYFLLSEKIGVFDRIYSGIIKNSILIKTIGWAVPLKNISLFSVINSVELFPSNGAKLVRSAGNSAIFIGKFHDKAILKLNSGWKLFVLDSCFATLGVVSNSNHKYDIIGKAGKMRALGFKSIVRGIAKNPCDHPHGGGNGKKSKPVNPVSAWGRFAKNVHSNNTKIDKIKRRSFKNFYV